MQVEARTNGTSIIELVGVFKSYREGAVDRRVLAGADAKIRRGELAVLIGKSGSGKTTLLNLVSGIDRPDGGSVRVCGHALEALDERSRTLFRRDHVGFVFQSFNLLPTLTVLENVLLPLELSRREVDRECGLARLDEVSLADRWRSYPDVLSGGERQRVAIARALVLDPPLILADEPTGNLDVDTGRAVIELLDDLVRRHGKTMLMVTHGREVVGIADRLLTIRDGKLVESSVKDARA